MFDSIIEKPNPKLPVDSNIQVLKWTTAALKGLVARYETTRRTPWRMEDLDADFYTKLAAAVVAFEMPVDRIEGKFKLGQNRCREDRIGTLEGLKAEGAPESDALAEFIRQHAPVE
jgi:transcriptional regulator